MFAWRRKQASFFISVPITIAVLYVVGTFIYPKPSPKIGQLIFSETGVIEVGTSLFYLLASAVAFIIFLRANSRIGKWRVVYLLIALGSLFIALEEINYGQYFFGFETIDKVSEFNHKGEFNFHNMFGNHPSHYLNTLATVAFPLLFIVLPVIAMHGKDHYSRQDWAYYVLPDCRLILFVVIGQLMSWYDDLLEPLGFKNIWTRATEFKELYWSMAVMFWAIMLYRRILAGAPSFTVSEEISAEKEELVEVYAAED